MSQQWHKTYPYLRFHEIFSKNYSVENRNIYHLFMKWQMQRIQLRLQKDFGFIVVLECTPKFRKKARKVISRYRISFLSQHLCSISKQMGWLWECLEMIFRMFPVYTQKTVPQRYLFFSICIGIAVRSCCVGCLIDTLHSSVKIFYLFVSSQLGFIFLWSCIQVHLEIYSQRFYKIFMYLTFNLAKIDTL